MSLINCPHCKHKVSEEALTCPNCSKPIQVLSDRTCNDCGKRLPKRKRKCSECGHVNNNSKTKQMSKNDNSRNLSILVVILLLVGGYFFLDSQGFFNTPSGEHEIEELEIPDGVYALTEKRREDAITCNLSIMEYGKTIRVNGSKAYTTTNFINESTYEIIHQSGNAFKIGPANSTCFYDDEKLIFTCNDKEIVFQKQ